MTQYVERVKRLRAFNEPNGSFGVEQAIGSFVDIHAREDSVKLTLDRPMETPLLVQQHLDGYPEKVFMPKAASLDYSTNLRGLSGRATATAGSATVYDINPLIACFGGSQSSTGTTIASTSTVTVLNVTSAAGMFEGGALACATGAGGALECREIKTVSSNVVTLKLALSSIPANASVVYAPYTFSMGNTDGGQNVSLQAVVEGMSASDKWLLLGGAPKSSPKFEFQPGTVPKISWSWMFANWALANGVETTMNLTSTAISDQAYASTSINAVMDSELRVATVGTSALAGTLVDASSITITPEVKYGPHKTPAGVNTIKQWVRLRTGNPAVTGEFKAPYESTVWRDFRDAKTDRAVFYQIGSSVANGAVLISAPRVAFDDFQREEQDGLAGQAVRFYGKLDNATTTNTNNLQKSAFRIHLF